MYQVPYLDLTEFTRLYQTIAPDREKIRMREKQILIHVLILHYHWSSLLHKTLRLNKFYETLKIEETNEARLMHIANSIIFLTNRMLKQSGQQKRFIYKTSVAKNRVASIRNGNKKLGL